MSSFRVSVVAATFLLCVSLIGVVQLLQDSNELIGAGLVPSSSSSISVDASHRRLQFSQAEQELAKVRPIIFTYYEQPAHSDLLNDDTLDLIENWRKAWFDMGWNPIILSPQQAQQLPQYEQLMALIPSEDLITANAIRNYKRWMAMAFVGGGWLADYQLWPLNYFLSHGRALPNDGAMTVYMGTNPVLLSGTAEEYLRMAHQIGQTAEKIIGHQKWLNENYPESYKKSVPWNDGIALQELRKNVSKDMFKVRGDVVDNRKMTQDGIYECGVTEGKRAVFVRAPQANKSPDNRGSTARKFLNGWRNSCEVGRVSELVTSKTN